jgi:hypothetical protein
VPAFVDRSGVRSDGRGFPGIRGALRRSGLRIGDVYLTESHDGSAIKVDSKNMPRSPSTPAEEEARLLKCRDILSLQMTEGLLR